MLLKSACLTAVLATLSGAASAMPRLSAIIDLTTFRSTVEDTDPNDGIVASVASVFSGRSVEACISRPLPVQCTPRHPVGPQVNTSDPDEAIRTVGVVPDLQAEATADARQLSGLVEGTRPTGFLGARSADRHMLTFSGAGRFTAEVDYHFEGTGFDDTYPVGSAIAGFSFADQIWVVQMLVEPAGSPDASRHDTLRMSWDVTDGQQVPLDIYLFSQTYGPFNPIPPVPEPGTWAMGLTGLALTALGARRRRPSSR